jgi:hypothetical protein
MLAPAIEHHLASAEHLSSEPHRSPTEDLSDGDLTMGSEIPLALETEDKEFGPEPEPTDQINGLEPVQHTATSGQSILSQEGATVMTSPAAAEDHPSTAVTPLVPPVDTPTSNIPEIVIDPRDELLEPAGGHQKAVLEQSLVPTPTPTTSPLPASIKLEIIEDEPMPENEAITEELELAVQVKVEPGSPSTVRKTVSTPTVDALSATCRTESISSPRMQGAGLVTQPKRKHNPNGVFARRQILPWPFHVLDPDRNISAILLIEVCTMTYHSSHLLMCSNLVGDVLSHSNELGSSLCPILGSEKPTLRN